MKSRKKIAILLALLFVLLNFVTAFGAKSISDLNKEKKNIKDKATQTQSSLNQTQNEKKSVLAQVEALDNQLNQVQNELDKLTSQLTQTEEELKKNEKALEEAKDKKEKQYESLKYRLRVMYENGSIGYLQVILESQSFTDMLKRIEYINKIAEHDNSILDDYKKTEDLINQKVEEIKDQKENIELLANEQKAKKQTLDESIKTKEALVAKLSKDEASYLQQLSDLDKADKEVANLITQAEIAEQQKQQQAASSGDTSSTKVYTPSGGALQYPVPAYRGYKYNSPYGYRSSPISGKQEFHTGVDLKATMGTDIVAAESGTVIFAGNKGGYGKCVIINHGNGLSTLYAHNSQIVVKVGQQVQRGQVISKAGTTGYSTGVHLHFEVRINGKHTNPAGYIGH